VTKLPGRYAIRVGLAAMIGLGGAFIAVQPAQAVPTGCETPLIRSNWARSYCDGGTGYHRLRVTCVNHTGATYVVYSPWKGVAQYGYANCNPGSTPRTNWGDTGWRYQLRG
jgi:hypothetical protein